jgi:hypothetical protein
MDAKNKQTLRVTYDSRLALDFQDFKVPPDAGLLAYRGCDEAPGLTTCIKL